jgi:uncharacterized membrane protein/mono/diheme cytochrome c family protein
VRINALRTAWWRVLLALACSLSGLLGAAEPVGDVASPFAAQFFRERVEPVFVQNCYECHGNGRKKGGLDMRTLESLLAGGNEGVVLIPGNVAKSSLVTSIRHEHDDSELNMPPDAKLPEQAIADVTRWVEMGAPWPVGAETLTPTSATASAVAAPGLPPFTGRLHPVIVHFPIACLLLSVLAESLVLLRGERWKPVTAFLLVIGALGAMAAVVSGTILAERTTTEIVRHQLLGWVTMVGALTSACLLATPKRWPLRIAILATAALAGLTGHLGGALVYGSSWLGF